MKQSLPGLTLEALCAAKGLPVELLQELGCRDQQRNGRSVVAIPYRNAAGQVQAMRYRHSLEGARFTWRSGDKVALYGTDRLFAAEGLGWLLVCEGESDCWTAWHYGIPAVGVPGKDQWRGERGRVWAGHLEGLDVFVWQEPGAESFSESICRDLPHARVIVAPPGIKDVSEAHLKGRDVAALIDELRESAVAAREIRREHLDLHLRELEEQAREVLRAADPLELVRCAIVAAGYGGDPKAALITYLAATGRVLAMRRGAMPIHLLLLGPPSAGKSFTAQIVLSLMPAEAYHAIEAGSPRVMIYDDEPLEHRVLVFGEADSLPAGEDNPAASAVRNVMTDHYLHYRTVVRDPETGQFTVCDVEKPGPTTLITTAVRRLGRQLDSRLFILDVPDDQRQIASALTMQASLERQGGPEEPSPALLAFQAYLQARAPWEVVVPFADELAAHLASQPAEARVVRDFARLLSLIKAVTVMRHIHRQHDQQGRLIAEAADYATVYELINEMYKTSCGVGEKVRAVVSTVQDLLKEGRGLLIGNEQEAHVRLSQVQERLRLSKAASSRRVKAALQAGWLVNGETRRGYPFQLALGDPLPAETGLLRPESLGRSAVSAVTADEDSQEDRGSLLAVGEPLPNEVEVPCCLEGLDDCALACDAVGPDPLTLSAEVEATDIAAVIPVSVGAPSETAGPAGAGDVDSDPARRAVFADPHRPFASVEAQTLRRAAGLVVDIGAASIALLIRRLGVHEAEACSILDALHDAGIVGPDQGHLARSVIVTEGDLHRRLDAYLGLAT